MKLEFIKSVSGFDEHIMLLSDFNSLQALMFVGLINRLVRHPDISIDLNNFGFIHSFNCNLTLRTSEEDKGISTADDVNFFCDLTSQAYKNIEMLVEPFCKKELTLHQRLYSIKTPIGFLFSPSRTG